MKMAEKSVVPGNTPYSSLDKDPLALAEAIARMEQRTDTEQFSKMCKTLLAPHLHGVDTVLDLGTGTGALLGFVGKELPDARLVGVDSSRGMLERARTHLPNAEFIPADLAQPLPLNSRAFDLIMGSAVLLYLGEQDLASLFQQLKELLSAKGKMVFLEPEPSTEKIAGVTAVNTILYGGKRPADHVDRIVAPALLGAGFVIGADKQNSDIYRWSDSGTPYVQAFIRDRVERRQRESKIKPKDASSFLDEMSEALRSGSFLYEVNWRSVVAARSPESNE